jgi:Family of unknown function (DUF5317)
MHRRTAAMSATLAIGLVAAQLGAVHFATSSLLVRVVLPATVALVPAALWAHRRNVGVWVMYVGLGANLAAILANGGLMPIRRSTVAEAIGSDRAASYRAGGWVTHTKDVLVEDGEGHLLALGDGIVVPMGENGIVASPGDLVVLAGIMVLAGEYVWRRQRHRGAASRSIETPPASVRTSGAEGGAATSP